MATIDPDRREPEPLGRRVVVEEALRDVDDAILRQPDALEQDLEVADIRLVGADLLGRHHPVEVHTEPSSRGGEQIVVAVRQHAQAKASLQTVQRVRRIRERRPVLDRPRERADLVGGRFEAELLGDPSEAGGEDLGIRPIRAAFRGRLMSGVAGQDVLGITVDPVGVEDGPERRTQSGLPVDERPVAVEGQRVDIGEVDRVAHPRNCSRSGIVRSGMTSVRTLAAVLLLAIVVGGCAGAASAPQPAPTGGPVTTQADAVARVMAAEPRFSGIAQRDPDLIGQARWYEAVPASGVGAFLVTMQVGWGDCPAGCIDSHTWLYVVGPDGSVTLRSENGPAVPQDAWSASADPEAVTQGLHITAVAGPTCPVERMPPDPACAPKPVPNVTVEITDDHGHPQGMVVLDATGRASVDLEPGTFTITAQGATGFMSGPEPLRVVVEAGQVTDVTLSYDTGIR
jgi:hypothetical protein